MGCFFCYFRKSRERRAGEPFDRYGVKACTFPGEEKTTVYIKIPKQVQKQLPHCDGFLLQTMTQFRSVHRPVWSPTKLLHVQSVRSLEGSLPPCRFTLSAVQSLLDLSVRHHRQQYHIVVLSCSNIKYPSYCFQYIICKAHFIIFSSRLSLLGKSGQK